MMKKSDGIKKSAAGGTTRHNIRDVITNFDEHAKLFIE